MIARRLAVTPAWRAVLVVSLGVLGGCAIAPSGERNSAIMFAEINNDGSFQGQTFDSTQGQTGQGAFAQDLAPVERTPLFGENQDPIEPVNRAVFMVNDAVERNVLEPVALVYRDFVPEPIQRNVATLLRNLKLPRTAVNSLLQGKFEKAGKSAVRFFTNSITLWLGDLMPDEPYASEDAGQTLAVLTGTDPENGGPFIVLPLTGPTNVRDLVGSIIDGFIDPLGIVFSVPDVVSRSREAVSIVNGRANALEEIQTLRENSLDFYTSIRSLYRQKRANKIRDGAPPPLDAMEALPAVVITPIESGGAVAGDVTCDVEPAPAGCDAGQPSSSGRESIEVEFPLVRMED